MITGALALYRAVKEVIPTDGPWGRVEGTAFLPALATQQVSPLHGTIKPLRSGRNDAFVENDESGGYR
jgi:hypothetical protein